ncbi:MAG TPA: metallophosphoesterase family protein [Polyangia bacterium]
MALYGLIADVHGNFEALTAVLASLDALRVDRILCLGDLVGYNADADRCVELIADRHIACVAGNHDLIAIGQLGLERCAARPAFALRRTRKTLSSASRRYLADLPLSRVEEDLVAFHGSSRDPSEYLRTPTQLELAARPVSAGWPGTRVCLFGHTHEPLVHRTSLGISFVNPGSVDAARRLDKTASFATFDSASGLVALRCVSYDDAQAEGRACEGGYRMTAIDEALARPARLLRRIATRLEW